MASNEDGLRKSLDSLVEWCVEWGVKINVKKSAIMHIRKKSMARREMSYEVGGQEIPIYGIFQ